LDDPVSEDSGDGGCCIVESSALSKRIQKTFTIVVIVVSNVIGILVKLLKRFFFVETIPHRKEFRRKGTRFLGIDSKFVVAFRMI